MIISTLNDNNIAPFLNLFSEDSLSEAQSEDSQILGAIYEDEITGEETACGGLIFDIEERESPLGDFLIGVIKYIYVAEDFRRKHVGYNLLSCLLNTLSATGINGCMADIPMPEEYDNLCAFFQESGFTLSLTEGDFLESLEPDEETPIIRRALITAE